MSLISMTEFEEFIAEFPEMEQCYDFSREALDYCFDKDVTTEELIADS